MWAYGLSFCSHRKLAFIYSRGCFRKIFELFGSPNVFKRLKELSGGERVRLLIAKLVMKQTNFLILDEPTNHLDISTRELLEENLKEYKGTILFVSHDRYFASKIAEREINI